MKKLIVVIALLFSFIGVNMVFANGDTWTQKADFGGVDRSFAIAFSIGSKGYMGGGFSSSVTACKDFWEYDPATDIWTQRADLISEVASSPAFSIGNKGYTGVRLDNSNVIKGFAEYTPSNNTWVRKADLGEIARQNAAGFAIGNKGYIGLGQDESYETKKDFWEYDPNTDTWTRKGDFGGLGRYHARGFSIGNKGYICGGIGVVYDGTDVADPSTNAFKDFWEYDPVTDTWTRKSNIGGPGRQGIVGFSIGNKGYIYGGLAWDLHEVNNKDFWEYDPATDVWTKKADFGGISRSFAAGFSVGQKGYVGTGFSMELAANTKDFWEYNPSGCNTQLVISSLTASPASLWPPNNKMVPVTISAVVSDTCDPSPMTKIISVSSNEPTNSNAIAMGEAVITGNLTLKLLAQRNGNGKGRIYTIAIQSTDSSGNTATGTTTVVVPHDQGK